MAAVAVADICNTQHIACSLDPVTATEGEGGKPVNGEQQNGTENQEKLDGKDDGAVEGKEEETNVGADGESYGAGGGDEDEGEEDDDEEDDGAVPDGDEEDDDDDDGEDEEDDEDDDDEDDEDEDDEAPSQPAAKKLKK